MATLSFNRVGSDGKPVVARTIELTNAAIIAIRAAPGSGGKRYEDVTLAFDELLVNGMVSAKFPHIA